MSHDIRDSGANTSKKRHREYDSQQQIPSKKSRKLSNESDSPFEDVTRDQSPTVPSSRHTKKERKQNRSTRIHSLRKQLARGSLPATIQRERERELAALLHEQEKTTSRKQAKKTLEKYHYVRFIERRKAEKKLNQLRKQQIKLGDNPELKRRVHEMEVNVNYAIYAPLEQKYISVFASDTGKEQSEDSDLQHIATKTKPATWHAVEKAMVEGKGALEALRDSKAVSAPRTVDFESDSKSTKSGVDFKKQTNQKTFGRGVQALRRTQGISNDVQDTQDGDDQSESESDAVDGGFFER